MPIHGYTTKSVLVAIGQRYHVIVEADPQPNEEGKISNDSFWIRTQEAGCTDKFAPQGQDGSNKTGIVRYSSSQDPPNSPYWQVNQDCTDEYYDNLHPIVPWTVGPPANDRAGGVGENLTVKFQQSPSIFPLASFSLGGDKFNPLYIDYGNPTFLNLNYTGKWDPLWVVFPENYTEKDWVGHNSLFQRFPQQSHLVSRMRSISDSRSLS